MPSIEDLEQLYKSPIDFDALADAYPPLRAHLSGTSNGHYTLDFGDSKAQRSVTEALLWRDFGITMALPDDRLCPPIPNRLHYVNWIRKIVSVAVSDSRPALGLDIGTGASSIYPLIACALEPTWRFVATDVDELSLRYARRNVTDNHLDARINIIQSSLEQPLLNPLSDLDLPECGVLLSFLRKSGSSESAFSSFTFVMCNPPFYRDHAEIRQSALLKQFEPNSVCTGADVEMITPGGEVNFVQRILTESLVFKSRCRWYTSLLGKSSSVHEIVNMLRAHQIDNYAVTELVQGQTRRWVIAWSFGTLRLPDKLARPTSQSLRSIAPPSNEAVQEFSSITSGVLFTRLSAILGYLEGVRFVPNGDNLSGAEERRMHLRVTAFQKSWSRSFRRRRMGGSIPISKSETISDASETAIMVCELELFPSSKPADTLATTLLGSWQEGRLRADFESFWNHVTRKLITG